MEPKSQMPTSTDGLRSKTHVPTELMALIPGYLSRRESDVKELKIALSKGDYESISKIGHKLKGNGAGFGFDRITDIGAQLQDVVNEKRFEELPTVINSFEEEIAELKKMF